MKKIPTIVSLLLFTSSFIFAQSGKEFVSAFSISWGNKNSESSSHMAIDESGNSYLTRSFEDTLDVDPGPDVVNLIATSTGFGQDTYILLPAGLYFMDVEIDGQMQLKKVMIQ